jgi:hypothetical protein
MSDNKQTAKAEQAGGHTNAFIKTADGKIKKLSKEAEYTFYESLKNKNIPDHIHKFFPKFYGIETIGNKRILQPQLTPPFVLFSLSIVTPFHNV